MKNVFANFYGLEAFPTRCDKNLDYLLAEKKVLDIGSKILFNADVYKKRIRCSAETFLIEANHRGKKIGKRVCTRFDCWPWIRSLEDHSPTSKYLHKVFH